MFSENLSLQSKMRSDPEGYRSELNLIYDQFMEKQSSKDLADRALFLAQVTPFYPKELASFPNELVRFLLSSSAARNLPSAPRIDVTKALILLVNQKVIGIVETLEVFIELQTLGDMELQKLVADHVFQSIIQMNHDDPNNRTALQNIFFGMLQQEEEEEEAKANQALMTLCYLHKSKVWYDDSTANAICLASFHASSRIMIAALEYLNSEDNAQLKQSKDAIEKALDKAYYPPPGKFIYKKKTIRRPARNINQLLLSYKNIDSNYSSLLTNLKDPQGFAEKLFSRLQTCNESFETKVLMVKVIARAVGLHRLTLLSFYPYLQIYVQPHERYMPEFIDAAVQACHDLVPIHVVEPLYDQIVNQFVRVGVNPPEVIAIGLNAVRDICHRFRSLMTEDLLPLLDFYSGSNEKELVSAACSVIVLYRWIEDYQ